MDDACGQGRAGQGLAGVRAVLGAVLGGMLGRLWAGLGEAWLNCNLPHCGVHWSGDMCMAMCSSISQSD